VNGGKGGGLARRPGLRAPAPGVGGEPTRPPAPRQRSRPDLAARRDRRLATGGGFGPPSHGDSPGTGRAGRPRCRRLRRRVRGRRVDAAAGDRAAGNTAAPGVRRSRGRGRCASAPTRGFRRSTRRASRSTRRASRSTRGASRSAHPAGAAARSSARVCPATGGRLTDQGLGGRVPPGKTDLRRPRGASGRFGTTGAHAPAASRGRAHRGRECAPARAQLGLGATAHHAHRPAGRGSAGRPPRTPAGRRPREHSGAAARRTA
jgi:hypothetical protein